MILPIVTRPNPILKSKARLIQPEEIGQLQGFIQDMFDTLAYGGGVGLAANQVGSDLNLFVVSLEGRKHVFINPVVVDADPETETLQEGCLSLPGVVLNVARSRRIKAMYRDENGMQQVNDFGDGWARIFLHEFDHLQGIMIDDRVGPVKRMMAQKKALKARKRMARQEVTR